MTTDEYLKTCHNVPPLPEGWHWVLSTTTEDREMLTKPGTVRNYTYILIEITDREEQVQGKTRVMFPTENVSKYPEMVNMEMAQGCRKAYNSLYASAKLDFYRAMGLDTQL